MQPHILKSDLYLQSHSPKKAKLLRQTKTDAFRELCYYYLIDGAVFEENVESAQPIKLLFLKIS